MSEIMDLLNEVNESPIPFIESRLVGFLAAAHPKILREALDTIARHEGEKAKGN
jgi:hypothetical protein